jgi:hypothetical protein
LVLTMTIKEIRLVIYLQLFPPNTMVFFFPRLITQKPN